jgi:AcrR family transcriptional regulator
MTAATDEKRGGQATGGRRLTPRGLRTRARLVAAARQVFEQIPFRQARLTDITAAAGVAAGTFYTSFDSKEEIFREVADEVLQELSHAARRDADNAEGDAIRDIAHASRQYFLACLRNAGVVRSMEQLAVSDEGIIKSRRATVKVGVKRVERWIRRLQERGICDRELDPRTTAIALHTMNVRVAYDHLLLSGDPGDVEPLVAAVTRVWARTVGLEQPPRHPVSAGPEPESLLRR